jgi:hypothetical protein
MSLAHTETVRNAFEQRQLMPFPDTPWPIEATNAVYVAGARRWHAQPLAWETYQTGSGLLAYRLVPQPIGWLNFDPNECDRRAMVARTRPARVHRPPRSGAVLVPRMHRPGEEE